MWGARSTDFKKDGFGQTAREPRNAAMEALLPCGCVLKAVFLIPGHPQGRVKIE